MNKYNEEYRIDEIEEILNRLNLDVWGLFDIK